ncbi:MAG: OmpP1/FadL family transporter [Pseudorhodobacter sp.]
MQKTVSAIATASLLIAASSVQAGGIDLTQISYGTLFEEGRYLEFGLTVAAPDVKGSYPAAFGPFAGVSTGNMAKDMLGVSLAYKADINDRLSYALFFNTPYSADVSYGTGPYTGLDGRWKSRQATALLRYQFEQGFSVYGGLKYVRSKSTITIPDALIRGGLAAVAANPATPPAQAAQAAALAASPAGALNYSATGDWDGRVAGILGVAYERPDIALRVGLTYESGYTHKFDATETLPAVAGHPAFAPSTTRIKMPQTVTLDFQTGIAADTLLFGSLRWAEWSVWEVRPDGYNAIFGQNITDFADDVWTWRLGVGRRINDNFSVFGRVGYEKSNGGISSRLAPTDGRKSIGVGGTYTRDNMKITAGLEYIKIGEAIDGSGTVFDGNDSLGFGLTVGYRF